MSALFTPTNQKRLTNISIVRLKRGGKRFELACYPNKVKAWRDKVEKDINQVLQSQQIFENVSKGSLAKTADLERAFPGIPNIIEFILQNGETQGTELERRNENEALFKDVARIISEKCVNPDTNKQYSVNMIENMMKSCHINLNKNNKNSKQLALQTIKILRENPNLKIAPALLDLNIIIQKDVAQEILESASDFCSTVNQSNIQGNDHYINGSIEPENYHKLETFLKSRIKGKFSIEILDKSKFASTSITKIDSLKAENPTNKTNVIQKEQGSKKKVEGKRKKRQTFSDEELSDSILNVL